MRSIDSARPGAWPTTTPQLLTEAVPLVVLGGGLGAFGAWWAVNLLLTSNPMHRLPRLIEAGVPIDGAVLAFTLAAVTATVLLCGVPPAAAGARADLHEALKGSGNEGGKRRRQSVRALLVGSEVALAMVLVTAGGLLTNSFLRAASIELGFEPGQAITATPVPPDNKYGERSSPEYGHRLGALYREILEGTQAIPAVESVGLCFMPPLTPERFSLMPINIEGRPELRHDGEYLGEESQDANDYADMATYARATYRAEVTYVSPGYFRAAGVPLIRGEYFTEAGPVDPKVVVISESAARHFFPGDDPIGQRISVAVANARGLESWAGWRTVVGIVADVRNGNLEARPIPQVYVPHEQIQLGIGLPSLILRARDGIDPRTLAEELEAVIREVDPDVAVDSVLPLEDLLSRQLGQRRLYLALVMVFAACAILLATVGVAAVVAYATSQRTHEIGVRRALGARGSDVVGLILRQGLGVVLAGVAVGTAAAWSLSGILSSFLYEIAPTDALTFLIAAATVVAVALPACLIPARQAMMIGENHLGCAASIG